MSKSHRSSCVSFSRTGTGLCIYYLLAWSNLNFLHISQWITLPIQSCLALYSFCANLLYSLIMGLMVSSLSPHSLHLVFCCVLSILWYDWFLRRIIISYVKNIFIRKKFWRNNHLKCKHECTLWTNSLISKHKTILKSLQSRYLDIYVLLPILSSIHLWIEQTTLYIYIYI